MKNFITLLAFVLLTFSCQKKEPVPDIKIIDGPAGEPVALPQKIETTLRTNLVENLDGSGSNHTYNLRIYLPAAYKENKDLPIIYLMNDSFDANSILIQSTSTLYDRANEAMVSLGIDALIVSVDTDFRSGLDYDEFRGGQDNFTEFIHTELLPYIEEKYPHNTSSRTLMGMGTGALYALSSMFLEDVSEPIFENFIANSPYGIGNLVETIITPNEFPQSKSDLKLFVAISNNGADFDIRSIGNIFLSNYPWLTAEYEEFLSLNHEAIIKPGFTAGLKYIFAGE